MKKTISLIISFVIAFSSIAIGVSSLSAGAYSSWQEAYAAYLRDSISNETYTKNARYDLIYIDSDSTPELIVSLHFNHHSSMDILTYSNGKAVKIGNFYASGGEIAYYEKQSIIVSGGGAFDESWEDFYKISGTTYSELDHFRSLPVKGDDGYAIADENGMISYRYTINDKEVTKEEFDKRLNHYDELYGKSKPCCGQYEINEKGISSNLKSPNATSSLTEKQEEELKEFIKDFLWTYSDNISNGSPLVPLIAENKMRRSYDYNNSSDSTLIACLLYFGAYCMFYNTNKPDEKNRTEYYQYEGNYIKDPQNRFNNQYTKTKASRVDWIAKNLFNCSNEDINSMRKNGELSFSKSTSNLDVKQLSSFYYENGYYYCGSASGIGTPWEYTVIIDNVIKIGDFYGVEYTYGVTDAGDPTTHYYKSNRAILQYKSIVGINYWSLYKNAKNLDWTTSIIGLNSKKNSKNEVLKKSIPFQVDNNRTINIDTDWTWDYFNKNASEYDHNLTMAGLLLSQATEISSDYAEKVLTDKDKNESNDFGFEHPKSVYYGDQNFKIHPAASFASKQITINGSKKILIVAVTRGTSSWNDFITDLGAVFDGFFNASENVFYELENYIEAIKNGSYFDIEPTRDNTIFFITGHSLGGAISQLLAKKCESYFANRNNIFAYTFAAPNVETGSYNVDAYTNIHNIINSSDAVPNVPVGYKKFGHCWYYGEGFHETDEAERTVFGGSWNAITAEINVLYDHLLNRYLTFVLSGLPKNMGSGASNPYNLSSVHCPVDITIYNKEGKLLGYTKGEVSTFSEDSTVLVYTDGESKYVVAPDGVEYTIRFTATGDGTMTYIQQKRESIGDEVISEKKFEDVEIKKGDVFRADVFNDIATENITFEKTNEDTFAGYDDPGESEPKSEDGANPGKPKIVAIIIASVAVAAVIVAAILFVILKKKKQAQVIETEAAKEKLQETGSDPQPAAEAVPPAPSAPKIEYSCKELGCGGRCSLCKQEVEMIYLVSARKNGKEQEAAVCRACAEKVIARFKKQNNTGNN